MKHTGISFSRKQQRRSACIQVIHLKITVLKSWIIIILENEMDKSFMTTEK